MSLGLAVFASVVLILLVYNKPFRRVFAWIAGISAGLTLIGALGWYGYARYQKHAEEKRTAAHKKLIDACVARYSASVGRADIFVQVACEDDPNRDWSKESTVPIPPGAVIAPAGWNLEKQKALDSSSPYNLFEATSSTGEVQRVAVPRGQEDEFYAGAVKKHYRLDSIRFLRGLPADWEKDKK